VTATGELRVNRSAGRGRAADVDIVIPVYNEETGLEPSVLRLEEYLSTRFPFSWVITIVDNASVDRSWAIACRLAGQLDGVQAIHLDQKGRGRALRAAWSVSPAAVVAYMDVDLSTDLDALLPVVGPLLSGHSDLAIGSRLAPGARVVRGLKREVISRMYNAILRATLGNDFSDAQCGFKALRAEVARALLPLIEDDGWFFDTELLVLAEHNGLRIHEVPVDWTDDPDTKVAVADTAMGDLRGIWRLVRRFAAGEGALPPGTLPAPVAVPAGLDGQVVRFIGIGAVSTALFALLFLALTPSLGPIGADIVALGLCAAVNVAANRRITFSRRGRPGRLRHYRAGLAITALPLALSIATLVLLGATGAYSVGLALVALSAVNAAVATARFVLLRNWVFRPATRSVGQG
jgi:putative flippase GtrA